MALTQLVVNGTPVPDLIIEPDPSLDPAEPRVQWVEIPGGVDIDTSTLLTDGVPTFKRASMVLACALVSGETQFQARRRLSALWHGQLLNVWLSDDPGHYLRGRVKLTDWSWPGKGPAVRFKLTVDAEPYVYDAVATSVQVIAATGNGKAFTLNPTGYTVCPTVVSTGSATIKVGDKSQAISAGTYTNLDLLLLKPGVPVTGAVVGATSVTVTFSWQGGYVG